jgi:N utilization substance protein B
MSEAGTPGFSRYARSRARRSAIQAYYQWQMTRQPARDVLNEFEAHRAELRKADTEYFKRVFKGMVAESGLLDDYIAPLLDRPVRELDPVERAVLHLGCYELLYCPEVPWRSIINEAVELAKMFGAEQSHKYINGVLDKLAQQIRSVEISTAP